MAPRGATLLLLAGVALLVAAVPLAAQDPPLGAPRTAVLYVELPEGGPDAENGRDLGTGGLETGVDVNSRVEIRIDREELEKLLLALTPEAQTDPAIARLLDRLDALQTAVSKIGELALAYREEAALYEETLAQIARERLEPELRDRLDQATARRATIALEILDALQQSLIARFREEGLDQDAAETRSDRAIDPIFDRVPEGLPYNLVALSALFDAEIRHVESAVRERLAGLDGSGLGVELRGHLVRVDGTAIAIPLPGHNRVEEGIEQRFQKVDFTLSAEERALHEQYEALVERIAEARAEGEDILGAVRQAFEAERLPIVEALEAAGTAVEDAGDQLDVLLGWADADRLREWATGPAIDALDEANDPAWREFRQILDAVERDVDTLSDLGALAESIRGAPLPDAVTELMNTLSNRELKDSVVRALTPRVWADRLAAVRRLVENADPGSLAVLASIDGPIMAWNDTVASLEAIATALAPVKDGARQALASLRGGAVAPVAVDLPEPAGQRRRAVREDLDTEFNLRTLPGRRQPGDEIRLAYVFYSGEAPIEDAEWNDTLRIQSYGWQGRAYASVALVRFETAAGDERWEPTAPISYLLHHRPWPAAGEAGIKKGAGGPRFTFGFSTMPLDFVEEESVELGIAATVGLFNNFVMLGYGVNLQADEEEFLFFSLRPFSLGSMFSPGGQ